MDADAQALTEMILEAAHGAFSEVCDQNPDDSFYAFVLCTHDDVNHVAACVNSLENHQKLLDRHGLEASSPDDEYFRWTPAEWGDYEFVGNEHFEKVDAWLREQLQAIDEEDFGSLKLLVLESMVNALGALDTGGFWGKASKRAKVTLFVTVYDSELAEGVEDESAKALNSRNVYRRFKNRFAETEKAERLELERKQAARDAVSSLPIEEQIQFWLAEVEQLIDDPPENEFQASSEVMENLRLLGEPAFLPMLDLVGRLKTHEGHRSGGAAFSMLEIISQSSASSEELHRRLAELTLEYCAYNQTLERRQTTPLHLAICLHALFPGYPEVKMTGRNQVVGEEEVVERARQFLKSKRLA